MRIHYFDYPKCFINRINQVYDFFNKISLNINFIYMIIPFCCNHTCYCVRMVSVTSASRYITSASRYQSRSFDVHPRSDFTELAEAVPTDSFYGKK